MSTMENSTVLDTYIIVDEARLVVKILSSDADIAELKNWEFSIATALFAPFAPFALI